MQQPPLSHPYTVLLIGNYEPDRQRSMLRYAQQLSEGLQSLNVNVELFQPPVVVGKIGASPSGIGKWLGYIDKFILTPISLKKRLRQIKGLVIVHICDHSNAPYTRWLSSDPHIITCHDLLAVRSALGEFPQNKTSWTGQQLQAMILRGLKRCHCITSVSSATRDDVIRLVGNDHSLKHTIPNALDDRFIQEANLPQRSSPVEKRLVESRYVMHIGSDSWYKNRVSVLRIFSKLTEDEPDLKLVFIGPEYSDNVLRENQCEHLAEQLLYLKNIDDETLRNIYREADLLLFPSWIEGFGWPILEAQACGCAVFTLDQAPMNELNAIPSLRLQHSPEDTPQWENLAAAQCLEYMNAPEQVQNELKNTIKAFAATFSLEFIIPQYIQLYEAQLESE
tara:strand:- start:10505 stop:11683 length:1179 start_codon:yes stop_codon:yes gene_type:complete